jgi:hypothetical protein
MNRTSSQSEFTASADDTEAHLAVTVGHRDFRDRGHLDDQALVGMARIIQTPWHVGRVE